MSKSEVFFLKSLMELTDSYAGVKIEVVSKELKKHACVLYSSIIYFIHDIAFTLTCFSRENL